MTVAKLPEDYGMLFHDDGHEAAAGLGCPLKGCKHKFKVVWKAEGLVSFRKMNLEIMRMLKEHMQRDHGVKK